jgi:putative RecB family exonuclease
MLKGLIDKIFSFFAKPGIEISYSRINAYQACPYKYKLIYIEGKKVPPNQFISLGISIHRALDDYHAKKGGDFDELIESYNKSWKNEGFSSPQQAYEYFEKGRNILENYFRETLNCKTEIIYLEKDFIFPMGKNKVKGIIDRIDRHPDGTYEVIDYKTHKDIWKQEKADTDLQMSLYALACEKVFGFKADMLTFYFLAFGRKINTSRTKEQLAGALKTAADVSEKIIKQVFTPNIKFCPRCDFKKSCPQSTARQ